MNLFKESEEISKNESGELKIAEDEIKILEMKLLNRKKFRNIALPEDPNDKSNVFLEIRLHRRLRLHFCETYKMYCRSSERQTGELNYYQKMKVIKVATS